MNPKSLFKRLEAIIKPRNVLIVGVSGGPDSTALLHLLVEFSRQHPIRIIVAHVNHGIRGKAADADEEFVHDLAKHYGLVFESLRIVLTGSHLEEQGRIVRRDFFEELVAQYKAQWILTAHTQDDQLETIIFNFIRGSGIAGVGGMQIAEGFYLKPLLDFSKEEVFAYLKRNNLQFRRDSMNEDLSLSRVFVRKKILPLLEKINPSFRTTLVRNGAIFRDLEAFINQQAAEFLEKHRKEAGPGVSKSHLLFPLSAFKKLPAVLKAAVIHLAYKQYTKRYYNLSFIHVAQILNLIDQAIGKKRVILPGATFQVEQKHCYLYNL